MNKRKNISKVLDKKKQINILQHKTLIYKNVYM